MFAGDHVRVVPDDPAVIARTVQELIAAEMDAQKIRDLTLDNLRLHRERFQQPWKGIQQVQRAAPVDMKLPSSQSLEALITVP